MALPQAESKADFLTVKSCSAWTDADLRLCNVDIIDIDSASFFGIDIKDMPVPSVSPAILNTKASYPPQTHPLHTHTALTNEERLFFKYLEAAMVPDEHQTTAIIDFTIHILHLLGFTEPKPSKQHPEKREQYRRVLRKDHDLPLFMCGRTVHATADVCLLFPTTEAHLGETVLLLAKAAPYVRTEPNSSAEAQLFAQAIGAFQCYNRDRRRARLPPVESQTFLGVVMEGTTPVLYKSEITVGLVECVQSGQKPSKVTILQRLGLFSEPESTRLAGMIPIPNRKVMFSYLEALKGLI